MGFCLRYYSICGLGLVDTKKIQKKKSDDKSYDNIWDVTDDIKPLKGLMLDLEPIHLPPPPSPQQMEILAILQDKNL